MQTPFTSLPLQQTLILNIWNGCTVKYTTFLVLYSLEGAKAPENMLFPEK
jgi:hypothetical protein